MKKTVKITSVLLAVLLVVTALTGCANFEKKKAFMEYSASLSSDSDLYNSIQTDMDKVQTAINKRDLTTTKAVLQSKINPALKTLSQNATNRHSTITDTELANIDSHYVNYSTHMSDAFEMMLDGINTEDQAKLNKATSELNVAMQELSQYASGLQQYMNSYGIKDDGSIAQINAMLGN